MTRLQKNLSKFHVNARGSGLLGLLVVIVIIGIVFWYMTLGTEPDGNRRSTSPGAARENIEKARDATRSAELTVIKRAIQLYKSTHGQFPPDLQTLAAEDYIAEAALKDPSGQPYSYNPETGEVQ